MSSPLKDDILRGLRDAKGDWVSGEVFRIPAGVSRTAISKQVKGLLGMGYDIESSPRKGYRLVFEPDVLTPEAVSPYLRGPRFRHDRYHYLDETTSTNDHARNLAQAGAPEGTLVVAEAQRAGRGRRGRPWFGQRGNSLLFSIVLRPAFEPARCTLLPLLTAVALRESLHAQTGLDIGIKWPNDLLVDGRKLAGILCEISSDLERVEHAILGIGLNVNTPRNAFPKDIRNLGTSLYTAGRKKHRRARVLLGFLETLDPLLDLLWAGKTDAILDRWRQASVTLGRTIEVDMPNGVVLKGKAVDVDGSGALLFKDQGGHLHVLTGGEVHLGTRRHG
jgi:BirA family biotin operon repressor/biotin-[acetyl-CoA-carboxylase] ligase